MIPPRNDLAHVDTLPGRVIDFGIGDPRWVMKTQADLYSDITTAIIREYSTNAYDAHVMAGNPDPIQVSLPTMKNPFFTVEDKGVGMTMDLIEKVYTQFGVSDKRESLDTNGMLGYGSKSGVAYTTSFTVSTIRDGVRLDCVVQRRPDWHIVLKALDPMTTDEPNGTKITIPVHNVEEFRHKAADVFKFWKPGRVLVDGAEPTHAVGHKIVDDLYYSEEWNTSYVVLGNVAYRINNPTVLFGGTGMNPINFVAYVDSLGTTEDGAPIEFVPSREDLKYTDRTKATLHKVVAEFAGRITAEAKAEINKATTHAEAYAAWNKWTGRLGRGLFADLEFKGDKFVSDFPVKAQRYHVNRGRYSTQTIATFNVESMQRTLVVTGFNLNLSARHKAMAKEYAKQKDWDINYVLFIEGSTIDSPWVSKEKFVTYEALKEAVPTVRKDPNSVYRYHPNAGRVKGSWDYYDADGHHTEQPLPADKNVYWISLQADKRYNTLPVLKNFDPKGAVVIIPGNRQDKFLRENPEVKQIRVAAQEAVNKDGVSLLSKDAKALLNVPDFLRNLAKRLDLSQVDDPRWAKIRALVDVEEALLKNYKANMRLAELVGMGYNVKKYVPESTDNGLNEDYPLLVNITSTYKPLHEHVYVYMNAVYAAKKEKKNG